MVDHADAYSEDPREAALTWFADAKYGLFLHYGLYSLIGRHEWVQYREQIPVGEYAELQHHFTASHFDAEAIADLAAEGGMKYINITTRHHDGFCLWDTAHTTFNSVQSPCGRDLVDELATACASRGLGLCLYYSHGRDWKHPHAPNNGDYGTTARPDYDAPSPLYATGAAHDLEIYLDYMAAQITELLTQYGPIAAIWLDGIATPRAGDVDAFRCQDLYDLIHSLQPQVLVSYKDGLTGTEDFYAPERGWKSIDGLANKPVEICGTISGGWGFTAGTPHRDADAVWQELGEIVGAGRNLLLNTGPLPEGDIEEQDAATLRAVGKRIREEGFPG
jgi:alpha-L-fucosidase